MNHMRIVFVIPLLALLLGASCTSKIGSSVDTPEAQIKTGADSIHVAASLGTVLLNAHKITVPQAKSYSVILHAASEALDTMDAALVRCRADTHTAPTSAPDPCRASVTDIVVLVLDQVSAVKKSLDSK